MFSYIKSQLSWQQIYKQYCETGGSSPTTENFFDTNSLEKYGDFYCHLLLKGIPPIGDTKKERIKVSTVIRNLPFRISDKKTWVITIVFDENKKENIPPPCQVFSTEWARWEDQIEKKRINFCLKRFESSKEGVIYLSPEDIHLIERTMIINMKGDVFLDPTKKGSLKEFVVRSGYQWE